ncbi:hypothetical protein HHK36_029896 [Tetracentron sinense]|uniref:Uncharacterized protein n=1 Tax=Tetracentron sinense TaxID=13715 RepID=A0A835D310_TETSI|nr:hypothetical protein HHK36_029896 [Tetracentron sinense]
MVKIEDQPRYRTQKGRIAQNVMAVVGFDMKFTYVLARWEEFARDPKVLKAAVRDAPTKLLIPTGAIGAAKASFRGWRLTIRAA